MPEPKARKRQTLKIAKPEEGKARKVSLVLSAENDQRLSILAALRHVDRSTLANEILGPALAGVRAYAPGQPGEETPDGETLRGSALRSG